MAGKEGKYHNIYNIDLRYATCVRYDKPCVYAGLQRHTYSLFTCQGVATELLNTLGKSPMTKDCPQALK